MIVLKYGFHENGKLVEGIYSVLINCKQYTKNYIKDGKKPCLFKNSKYFLDILQIVTTASGHSPYYHGVGISDAKTVKELRTLFCDCTW